MANPVGRVTVSGEPMLAGHGREADEEIGPRAGLEQSRLGEGRDVIGRLEEPVRPATLGMHDAFGHTLAVELLHLLDEIGVLEQDRPVGPDGE